MVAVAVALLLWAAAATDSTAQKLSEEHPQLPSITNEDFIRRCVDTHNKYRSAVTPPASDMLYMTWDKALAETAAGWARNCQFSHNPLLKKPGKLHPSFPTLGENIWVASTYTMFTAEKAIESWNDEVDFYHYKENSCSNVCGHYTQVVWAKSYKVGCAVQMCSQGVVGFSKVPEATIFVCNYGDAGNIRGVHPYQEGQPCAKCHGTPCRLNMCGYWSPGKDDTPPVTAGHSACSQFCIRVLAIRPVLLLLTMLAVFGVQRVYPNLFAYE